MITVLTLGGQIEEFRINQENSLEELTFLIHERLGVPLAVQRLFKGEIQLADNCGSKSLQSLGVVDGDCLFLLILDEEKLEALRAVCDAALARLPWQREFDDVAAQQRAQQAGCTQQEIDHQVEKGLALRAVYDEVLTGSTLDGDARASERARQLGCTQREIDQQINKGFEHAAASSEEFVIDKELGGKKNGTTHVTFCDIGARDKERGEQSATTLKSKPSRKAFEVVDVLVPQVSKRHFLNAMIVRTSRDAFLVGSDICYFLDLPYESSDPDVVALTSEYDNTACVEVGGDDLVLILSFVPPSAAAIRPLVQLKHDLEQNGQDHCSEYEQVLSRLIRLSQRFQRLERDALFQSFEDMFGNCFFVSPTMINMLLSKTASELVDGYIELRHLGKRDYLQLGLLEMVYFQDHMSAVRWWMHTDNLDAGNEEYYNFNLGQVLSKFPILPASTIQGRYKTAFALNRELEFLMLMQTIILISAEDWRAIRHPKGKDFVHKDIHAHLFLEEAQLGTSPFSDTRASPSGEQRAANSCKQADCCDAYIRRPSSEVEPFFKVHDRLLRPD